MLPLFVNVNHVFLLARCCKKSHVSSDHRLPTSHEGQQDGTFQTGRTILGIVCFCVFCFQQAPSTVCSAVEGRHSFAGDTMVLLMASWHRGAVGSHPRPLPDVSCVGGSREGCRAMDTRSDLHIHAAADSRACRQAAARQSRKIFSVCVAAGSVDNFDPVDNSSRVTGDSNTQCVKEQCHAGCKFRNCSFCGDFVDSITNSCNTRASSELC